MLLLFQVGAPHDAPGGAADGAEPRDAGEAERALLDWIGAERAAAGLPPLAEAPPLRDAARGHSEAMREGGFFGHVDPSRGTLVERLGAQDVLYSLATENVSRTASIAVAHDCFMASPGHRGNVLDPRATHVGVGVVREGEAWWVTEVFARLLPAGDGDGIRSAVVQRIAAVREGAGLPPLTERRVLSDLAQEIAEEAAREGRPSLVREEARPDLGDRVRFALPWAGRVAASLVVADTPQAVGSAGPVLDGGFSQVGVGLARGPGPVAEGGRRVGDGLLWVVLVLAGRDQDPTP
ncbi:CAP domain-containing protein [Myxococcota bacterium]|nr:CAP domain-containing protein [Myxococcota bacterium]